MNVKEFDKYCQSLIDEKIVPGLAVCLLDDKDTFINCYGVKDLDTKEKVDLDTLFDLASLTKVLATTTSILRFVEEGRIKLSDKVSMYVEGLNSDATVQQCLLHTSGYLAGRVDYRYMSKQDLIEAVLNHPQEESLKGIPNYSDINFILLGWLIDKVTGSYKDYVGLEILDRLNLKDTMFNPKDIERCCSYEVTSDHGLIRGRVHDGKAYLLDGVSGHAGLFSTIKDISIFLRAYLNEDETIFSKDTFALLKQPQVITPIRQRTYGWVCKDVERKFLDNHKEVIFHSGFTGNYLYIDFEEKMAVGILSNRIHPTRTNKKIIDKLDEIYTNAYKAIKEIE